MENEKERIYSLKQKSLPNCEIKWKLENFVTHAKFTQASAFKYKDDFVDAVNLNLEGTIFNKAELLSLESSIPWLNKINCIVYVHYKSKTVALQIFTKI